MRYAALCLILLLSACSEENASQSQEAKKDHVLRGKLDAVYDSKDAMNVTNNNLHNREDISKQIAGN